MLNIMRNVNVILFCVLKIFDIFMMFIFLFKRIRRFLQFEHDKRTCRIVMTLYSHEHNLKIISSTQRSFKNKLKFIFLIRSYINRALCDLCLSLCNNICFEVIFAINCRKCFLFVSFLYFDFRLFFNFDAYKHRHDDDLLWYFEWHWHFINILCYNVYVFIILNSLIF